MNKTKIIASPFGKVKIGPNTTPSIKSKVEFSGIKKEVERIAKRGNVQVDELRNDGREYVSG